MRGLLKLKRLFLPSTWTIIFCKTTVLFEKLEGSILVHYMLSKAAEVFNILKTRSAKRTYHKQRFVLKNWEVFLKIIQDL